MSQEMLHVVFEISKAVLQRISSTKVTSDESATYPFT